MKYYVRTLTDIPCPSCDDGTNLDDVETCHGLVTVTDAADKDWDLPDHHMACPQCRVVFDHQLNVLP